MVVKMPVKYSAIERASIILIAPSMKRPNHIKPVIMMFG